MAEIGQRNTWRFPMESTAVGNAATEKERYHLNRIKFWQDEHEKAIKKLETATVKIERQQVTGGERVAAVVDQTAANRVRECEWKISDHQKSAAEYHRWAAALSSNGQAFVSLDVDDVHYFGIGDSLPEDPDD